MSGMGEETSSKEMNEKTHPRVEFLVVLNANSYGCTNRTVVDSVLFYVSRCQGKRELLGGERVAGWSLPCDGCEGGGLGQRNSWLSIRVAGIQLVSNMRDIARMRSMHE